MYLFISIVQVEPMIEVGKVRNKKIYHTKQWSYTFLCVGNPPINLSQVVTGDALRQAVSEPSVADQLQSLLPETGEDPVAIVSSPQFHQVNRIELFTSSYFMETVWYYLL